MIIAIIFYLLTAVHDYYIWEASSKKKEHRKLVKSWHDLRFVMEIIIITPLCFYAKDNLLESLILLCFFAWTKLTVFNFSYNILKENKWYHLSNFSNKIDVFFKPYEKQFAFFNIIIWVSLLALSVLLKYSVI